MSMKPVHYNIHLEPNMNTFTCPGTVVIEIKADDTFKDVTLNAKNLAIWNCKVNNGEKSLDCAFSVNPIKETLTLELPEELGAGSYRVTVEFMAKISEQLYGLYQSKYEHEGKEKYLAVTQFEERYARWAFPCFDQPAKKATFDIEYVIDENHQGIANTPVAEEKSLANGKKLVKFERTPVMSTYLLFFGIGEFEFIERKAGDLLVRVATTPGKTQYGDFALEFNGKTMKYLEEYTGIKYPITKLDAIAVPDFAFGAMENYGAVTYRENLLLVYPGVTSSGNLADIAMIIAHENAHMWFGNLCSPADWKYIWLNESFATYFGYAVTEHFYPEWHNFERLINHRVSAAFNRDSLLETFPIELPDEEGEEIKIGAATTPIIYSKGSAMLRMLRAYLGEKPFKAAINRFLEKYAFSNATTEEYWTEFEAATGEPIKDFASSWVHQPGYPVIKVKREGSNLLFEQQRFTLLPNESEQTWLIPITVQFFLEDGSSTTTKMLLKEKSSKLAIPENVDAFNLNIDQTGFYRVKYEPADLESLGKYIRDKKLSVLDRFGLENDLFAFVASGDNTLDDYLTFLSNYQQEDGFITLMSICENLSSAHSVIEAKRDKISETGKMLLKHVLEKIGYEPVEGESFLITTMRGTLLWMAFKFGDEEVASFAKEKFQVLLDGKRIHKDLMSMVLRTGAMSNPKALDYFTGKLSSADTPASEITQVIISMGYIQDKKKLEKALDLIFNKAKSNVRLYAVVGLSDNPAAVGDAWKWYKDNLEKIEKLHHYHQEMVISTLIPVAGLGKEKEVKIFFEEYMDGHPKVKDTIKMTLELLEINAGLRNA